MAGAEQPAAGHIDLRLAAGRGAGVAAGGLQEADLMWAGAGQADPTAAGLV